MEYLLDGLAQLGQLEVLIALVVGAVAGVIIGAIPGLGPAVGIAIPAILINTPGTVVSVLTTFDGYPMTLRGQARRALSIAYSSSFLGGVISVLVLAFLAPLLAEVAKRFGSAEFALATVLGLVLIVVAHRGQVLAAAMTLGFGLFLSTIGLEHAFASMRFTFGQGWLLGGVSLVPMALGLFAISQAFSLILGHDRAKEESGTISRNPLQGLLEVFRYPVTLLRSAGFGVTMGILPGVGEFIAQFFSYSTARRFSKTPELFGKGAPEGLIACETSNNAVPASALVPLLALGIPGEALTAMMLAVFMVHNYIPGPTLFDTRPEFIGGLYLSLFFMNVVILLFLLVATRWIVLVTRLEPRMLGVSVLALSLVGTYTQNYRLSDCVLAVVFGILGYALKRCNVPIVPIVLGVVLGPILESRIRQSLGISSGDLSIFVTRPISAVLLAVIVVLLAATVVAGLRRSGPRRPERSHP